MLSLIDEYSRMCLAIEVQRCQRSDDVLHLIADAMMARMAPPIHIRSDNRPKPIAKTPRGLAAL